MLPSKTWQSGSCIQFLYIPLLITTFFTYTLHASFHLRRTNHYCNSHFFTANEKAFTYPLLSATEAELGCLLLKTICDAPQSVVGSKFNYRAE